LYVKVHNKMYTYDECMEMIDYISPAGNKTVLCTVMNFMEVIDLTHNLENGMPVYPGSEQAVVLKSAAYGSLGYQETKLQFSAHTGTHIDCGRHFFEHGLDTGNTPPDRFMGRALVIDCREMQEQTHILKSHLVSFAGRLEITDFVLFHTGWSRFWGMDGYFRGYPTPDPEAAQYLTGFPLKGIGIDAISLDPADSTDFPVHRILLSRGFLLIENLTCLENLPESGFFFSCFPLKITDGDGSPVRAVGITGSME
jgi:arylformamidase